MSHNTGYKNNFLYEQEKRSASSNTRKNSSNIQNRTNDGKDKHIGMNSNSNSNLNTNYNKKAYLSSGMLSMNNKIENIEDYQRLAKKYYSIILSLQDELTKQTIKNYTLLEENINLKNQLQSGNQSNKP